MAHAQQTDPVVAIAADQTSVTEGETATFTLTSNVPVTAALTVDISVSDPGSFLRGDQWRSPAVLPETASFEAGASTAQVSLTTRDDWRDIPDNSLTVTVDAGTGYSTSSDSASASVTVTDNDVAPELELQLDKTTLVEGEALTVTVRRRGNSRNPVQAPLAYGFQGQELKHGQVTINEGQRNFTFVPDTDDNDVDEADRTFEVKILPLTDTHDGVTESEYWTVRGSRTVTATVTDNDLPMVSVEALAQSYEEGEIGMIRIRRTGDLTVRLSVVVSRTQSPGVTNQFSSSQPSLLT